MLVIQVLDVSRSGVGAAGRRLRDPRARLRPARVLVTLLYAMKNRGKKKGMGFSFGGGSPFGFGSGGGGQTQMKGSDLIYELPLTIREVMTGAKIRSPSGEKSGLPSTVWCNAVGLSTTGTP